MLKRERVVNRLQSRPADDFWFRARAYRLINAFTANPRQPHAAPKVAKDIPKDVTTVASGEEIADQVVIVTPAIISTVTKPQATVRNTLGV